MSRSLDESRTDNSTREGYRVDVMSRLSLSVLLATLVTITACSKESSSVPSAANAPSTSFSGDTTRGKELITRHGCTVCHAVPGIDGFQGRLGPSLAGIASRRQFSNGRVENTPENLARFIRNPSSLNRQSTMPPVNVTPEEAADITAYLLTLR
jgi:cytochrome c2